MAARKVLIAGQQLIGPFGVINEGQVIPAKAPNMSAEDWKKTVKSWAVTGIAITKDSEDDVGHWNEDGNPLDDLPEDPLVPNTEELK